MGLNQPQFIDTSAQLSPHIPVLYHIICDKDSNAPEIHIRRETSTSGMPPIILLTGPKIQGKDPLIHDERHDRSRHYILLDCRHALNGTPFQPPSQWSQQGFYRLDTPEAMQLLSQLVAIPPPGSPQAFVFPPHRPMHAPLDPLASFPPVASYMPLPSHYVPYHHPVYLPSHISPPPAPIGQYHAPAPALHRSNSTSAVPGYRGHGMFTKRKPVNRNTMDPGLMSPGIQRVSPNYTGQLSRSKSTERKKAVRFSADPPTEHRYPPQDDDMGQNDDYDDRDHSPPPTTSAPSSSTSNYLDQLLGRMSLRRDTEPPELRIRSNRTRLHHTEV